MNRNRLGLIVLLMWLTGCQTIQPGADVIFMSGIIHTENPQQPVAEAIAIQNGHILAVGSNDEVLQWQGQGTRVIDLKGKMVLPGLLDSHIHSIEGALALSACSMDDEKLSLGELTTRIRQCADDQPGEDWLQVLNVRAVGTQLDRYRLDEILHDRPLFVISTDAHVAWANSKALAMAQVDKTTAAPANGSIGHGADGEPDGLLRDGATALVSQHIPPMPLPQRVAQLNETLQLLHGAGITGFLEANSNALSVDTFCELHRQGRLTATVTLALGSEGEPSAEEFQRLLALKSRAEQCGVKADTIKLYADGVMEYPTQTAGMLSPYLDGQGQPGHSLGATYIPPQQFNDFARQAAERGFSLHVHAIGDGAVRETLDAFAVVRHELPDSPVRLSMAHLQLIDQNDLPRFAQLDVLASLQLLWAQPDEYSVDAVLPYIGEERHQHLYPGASLQQVGATIAGGSDWNVSTYNPFAAMAIGVSRKNPQHPEFSPLNESEALPLASLLTAYTVNAARLMGQDDEVGSLIVGKQADLVVLASSLDETSAAQAIASSQVLMTMVKGQVVFGGL